MRQHKDVYAVFRNTVQPDQLEGTEIIEINHLNDIKDVVRRTRLSRSKIYEELESGRLKSVKVGRRRLVTESQLIDYIDNLITAGAREGAAQ
jgi:excisionase family DNA binding protein